MVDQDLAFALDRHRDDLMAISGVVGIGLSETATGSTIQLFVSPSVDQGHVLRQARAVVADIPLLLVSVGTPTASNDTWVV